MASNPELTKQVRELGTHDLGECTIRSINPHGTGTCSFVMVEGITFGFKILTSEAQGLTPGQVVKITVISRDDAYQGQSQRITWIKAIEGKNVKLPGEGNKTGAGNNGRSYSPAINAGRILAALITANPAATPAELHAQCDAHMTYLKKF